MASPRMKRFRTARMIGSALAFVACCLSVPASANYIGPSYIKVAGLKGNVSTAEHKGWLQAEAHYWTAKPPRNPIRGISGKESGLKFTGPLAPASGPSVLSLAIDKHNPALPDLLKLCQAGQPIPELVFAESSELARHPQEHGPRPENVPDYYEYSLKDAKLSCPEVEGAPEQAVAIHFSAIEWRNYAPQPKPLVITTQPANLPRGTDKGDSRTFVISWFAPIADANEKQCPTMNRKPTQDEYFALMPPERAAQQRAALADKGGANTTVLPYRGPDEMNVILLPGIVPDPGHVTPVADIVRGFDLDGKTSGSKGLPNYTSPDGRKGIDNRLFAVFGCVEGWRRKGFLPMIGNELRRAGGLSILVDITGIDDPRDDDEVFVTLLYSADPIKRDGTSKIVLPDFTFRANDNPEFSQDYVRFKAKMKNGVITTNVVPLVTMHEGPASTWSLASARMRLEFTAEGGLSATLGGYRDWRELLPMAFFQASDYENTIGFNAPAMYNAVRRAADGLRDPKTGTFYGLSAAYEMEGIPAFLPPDQRTNLAKGSKNAVAAIPTSDGEVK